MKKTLEHLPEHKQQDIQAIADILRDTVDEFVAGKSGKQSGFKIQKIILFGSYARPPSAEGKPGWVYDPAHGYISDYDILVIVNRMELVENLKLWKLADDRIKRRIEKIPVGVIVHTLKEVNQWLREGQYFFQDIREEGIELYSIDSRELSVPGNLTDEERREIAQKHFQKCFQNANEFFFVYETALNKGWLNNAAFQLHQASERFFACTLLVCTNYLPKTHDIEKLCHFCAQQDERFLQLFPKENQFHRRSFHRLRRAYVDARYSEHYEITVEELTYLSEEVEKLKMLTEEVCLERITSK
ncbi:HEPN domain protein [Vibrio aerogenes CECT 7868]|uniref:HEPN domain protein n=1 Tax=Vibrio aerogenes CECT 7868 TaxID=1216006 RepID=A0A1M5YWM4_9VIBR|nr:HEPN domain-containing protein [Vibrio aerogenes]SHI16399.1 HEPN domain protein [Vibrio aerogenes CECT 7868]